MEARHEATLTQPSYNAFCSIRLQTCTYLRTWQRQMTTIMQPFQCVLPPQIQETHRLRTQEQPLVAEHSEEPIRDRNDPSRNRRTHEVPFIAGCSHFTRKNTKFRALASSPKHTIAHATFMQTFQCDLPAQLQETHRTTHTGTTTRCKTQRRNTFATETTPAFPSSPLPIVTTSLPHHFTSSPLPIVTTSLPHHFLSSPLPFLTTSLSHHFPSSPLPIVTTSLPHHFPSSPLPIVTTSLRHHPVSWLLILLLCIVLWCTTLHQCQVSQFFLSVALVYDHPHINIP